MPELPEVETVVRDLRPRLVGRRIRSITASAYPLRQRWQARWAKQLVGRCFAEMNRRGKWIVIRLEGDVYLVIHLGMTGQLRVVPASARVEGHTHLVMALDRGRAELRFRDVRRFGSARVFAGQAQLDAFFSDTGLGPEPFELESAWWREQVVKTRRALKAMLLDQRVVAGVGNIYADESLFEAGLYPGQLGCDTTPRQAERLRRAIVMVLRRAIDKRGSSIRDYLDGSGQRGGYQEEFRVYGRTGQPCPKCRTPITAVRLAGRSTHFCPRCQTV